MKSIVTLLFVLSFLGSALARKCIQQPDGTTCCGLVIGVFSIPITEAFATTNGYFQDEDLPVCFYRTTSSVVQFDQLLANQTIDMLGSHIDNVIWRRLNFGRQLAVVSGGDLSRAYYLIANSARLDGWNSVAALSGKNIVVDSVDSGFVTGLRKILNDFGVTNVTYVPFGSNRAGIVAAGQVNGIPIAATLNNGAHPFQLASGVVSLAPQWEHLCPLQASGYLADNSWLAVQDNMDDLTKFLRGVLRGYEFVRDPANKATVMAWIGANQNPPITNQDQILYIYNDYVNNPASGLNYNQIPLKLALRNLVNARIEYGMSPPPIEGVDAFLADRVGGFVDLRALKSALASLGLENNYDTNPGTLGCPYANKGVIAPEPAKFTCSYSYSLNEYQGGFTANLNVYASNTSALTQNGAPGFAIKFSAKGNGATAPFHITNSWGTGSVTESTTGTTTTYTLTNAPYNAQNPANTIGFNANSQLPAPYNNICGLTINNQPCTVNTPTTASLKC